MASTPGGGTVSAASAPKRRSASRATDPFAYRDGALQCEGVMLAEIAAKVGTPFYVYSAAALEQGFEVLDNALQRRNRLIAFAVKANANLAVLRLLAGLGAGADIVSGGELHRALAAGVEPGSIVFSGVGKTATEIRAALEARIGLFNCESWPEAERISAVATELRCEATFGFRVNPGVAAGGHANISTGRAADKFGIGLDEAPDLYARAARLPGLRIAGIAVHVGSQICDIAPMREAFARVAELTGRLMDAGHMLDRVDLGGGLGIAYHENERPDTPAAYGAMIKEVMAPLPDAKIILEPGRLIAGNAGALVTRVEYVKERDERRFVIVDAGMNDLARPALYGARHEFRPLAQPEPRADVSPCDVVGPVCETTDSFAVGRCLPRLHAGDQLAIMSAGAYGASMASQYNSRPQIPEVMVSGRRFAVVRERPTPRHMIEGERCPDWIRSPTPAPRRA